MKEHACVCRQVSYLILNSLIRHMCLQSNTGPWQMSHNRSRMSCQRIPTPQSKERGRKWAIHPVSPSKLTNNMFSFSWRWVGGGTVEVDIEECVVRGCREATNVTLINISSYRRKHKVWGRSIVP